MSYKIIHNDSQKVLNQEKLKEIDFYKGIDLTFLDPPFNQGKEYNNYNDNISEEDYWNWIQSILKQIYNITSNGGAIYFMQREKNAEFVLKCLRITGWNFQNLIIWKKKTSAIPGANRFGKHYQIIAFATKGKRPRIFNRLRIDPPLPSNYKHKRENGLYVTDIWDDIRELTSGYFAGDEAIRKANGERFHKQQAPIELLLRIILSSSNPEDIILDPFAGTGTTSIVAEQLHRNSIAIEIDIKNIEIIKERLLNALRESDNIEKFKKDYHYTKDLNTIWPNSENILSEGESSNAYIS